MKRRSQAELIPEDASISPGERSFRVGWFSAVKRTDGARPEIAADYVARQGRTLRVVDVRDVDALTGVLGHVPGSDWIPLAEAGELHKRVGEFEPLVLVDNDGSRALALAAWLEEAGLAMVAAMRGGMVAWKEQGLAASRNGAIRERKGQLSALPKWAAAGSTEAFSLADIEEHVGHPRSVRWIKVAAFLLNGRLSCVDGRDHVAVVGSPGGDAGELVLALGALERLGHPALSDELISELLRRRLDAFGRFAFHTDTAAGNRLIAAIRADTRLKAFVAGMTEPLAFRQFFSSPPEAARAALLDLMGQPPHLGCGHLRLMTQFPQRWGVREGLTTQVLRAAMELRWRGRPDLEVTPLPGGHSEGAVVNVHIADELDAFSWVPLVSPSIAGRQMFVNHPTVAAFLRKQLARWLTQQHDVLRAPPSTAALFEAMQALHQQQLMATLGELAAGLPIFDVTVRADGKSEAKQVGAVPKKP